MSGPMAVCQLLAEQIRYLNSGAKVDFSGTSHIFVMSIGEPPQPHLTKIGGLPYLPRDVAWPLDDDFSPMPFIGQIYFSDSLSILPCDLPGDVLLFFGDPAFPEKWRSRWMKRAAQTELRLWGELPVVWDQLPLFGNLLGMEISGSWSYKFWPHPGNVNYDDDLTSRAYLFHPWATQICTAPFTFAKKIIPDNSTDVMIASLSPISVTREQVGAFVNCPGLFPSRSYRKIGIRDIFIPGIGDGTSVVVVYSPSIRDVYFQEIRP